MTSLMNNQFIEVELNDEKKYLEKRKGLKKLAALANKKIGHQIVCITLNTVQVSPQSVLPKLLRLFEQAKQCEKPSDLS